MKSNIASIWLVGLILTFLLIFSAYIIITVDYSATFKMKNEVLNILEKNKGFTIFAGQNVDSVVKPGTTVLGNVGSLRTINAFLAGSSYGAKGPCARGRAGEKWIGVKSLDYQTTSTGSLLDFSADDDTHYFYCIARFKTGRTYETYPSVYYQVQLFYKFEIPILKEFLPVRIEGTTDEVYLPSSSDILKGYENSNLYG